MFSHPWSADDVVSMDFELQDFSGMPDLIPDHAVASETAALVARNAYCDVMGCIAGAEIMIDNCLIMRRTEQHRSLRKLCSNLQLGMSRMPFSVCWTFMLPNIVGTSFTKLTC